MPMRYFVTGGAGFIGSNYVRGLLSGRWGNNVSGVTVFDSFTYAGNCHNLDECSADSRLTIVNGDIRNPQDILESLPGHDVVVHFAAESHVDRSIESCQPSLRNIQSLESVFSWRTRYGVPDTKRSPQTWKCR